MAVDCKIVGKLLLSAILAICTIKGSTISSNLVQLNDSYCVCPGQEVAYQCTVCVGGPSLSGLTLWTGNVFDCARSGNRIILRHRQFRNGLAVGECNNGAVMAHSIGVVESNLLVGGCYSSQLDISTNIDMNNKTVMCLHVDGSNDSITETVVDTATLTFKTEIPPPVNFYLSDAAPTHFTLNWNPPKFDCTTISYRVTGTRNCGICTNITINTPSITCSSISVDGQQCNLSIQAGSETCEDVLGVKSDPIQVALTIPEPPLLIVTEIEKWLIVIKFHETDNIIMDPANNSDEIGNLTQLLATTYVLSFFDFYSNDSCGSTSLSSSSCVDRACYGNFSTEEFSPICNHTTLVKVIIHAMNVFGNGSKSEPVIISIVAPEMSTMLMTAHSDVLVITSCALTGAFIAVVIVAVTLLTAYICNKKVRTKSYTEPCGLSTITSSRCSEGEMIYADVGPLTRATTQNYLLNDDMVEYVEVSHTTSTKDDSIQYHDADKYLNLDTLLIQISSHIGSNWYQFGQAVEIPKEILDRCLGYPTEQCIEEVLDYWLRIQSEKESKPTWKIVAKGLKAIGHNSLAEDILNVYKTGKLPVEDTHTVPESLPQDAKTDEAQQIPPPTPPKMLM